MEAVRADDTLFVADVTLCELAWVLAGAYHFGKDQIAGILDDLAHARQLRFQNSNRVARALDAFRSGRADFADYMISQAADEAGCDGVATFDRSLLREDGFFSP